MWSSSPASIWLCSLHYVFLQATPLRLYDIRGWGNALSYTLEEGTAFPCVPLHFNNCTSFARHRRLASQSQIQATPKVRTHISIFSRTTLPILTNLTLRVITWKLRNYHGKAYSRFELPSWLYCTHRGFET